MQRWKAGLGVRVGLYWEIAGTLERRARRRVDESQGGCQKVKKHWVMKVKIYSTVLRLELMINI